MNQLEMKVSLPSGDLKLRTGRLAGLANGACEVIFGDTVMLITSCVGQKLENADFLPLQVEFQERFYAAGKIRGSKFVKREGRPSDTAVLNGRVVDRPIRPLFPKGFVNETQVICTVLSLDPLTDPSALAINGASLSLLLSGIPFFGPVSGVHVGYRDGKYILFPTAEDIEKGQLDLIIAGSLDAVTMVEANCLELDDEKVLGAFDFAHKYIKEICEIQLKLVKEANVVPMKYEVLEVSSEAEEKILAEFSESMVEEFYGLGKSEFYAKLAEIKENIKKKYEDKFASEEWKEFYLEAVLKERLKEVMRRNVLEKEKRLDNRKLAEVRPVSCEVGVLPRTHGSAIFKRGDTQILTVTTLGGPQDMMVVEEMGRDFKKRYLHHYNFQPFATGEVKPLRGVSRREIGHGNLAERSLVPVLPSGEDFPYTMYLVSETLACNGSSSMGSVCGSTLSLMDAGVPIKSPVIGIAMGLVSDEEKGVFKVLSDIQAQEDFLGDMDFKVAGTKKGITGLQMDIKVKGLTIDLLRQALKQAREGMNYIEGKMLEVLPSPRKNLSAYAPLLMSFMIDPEMIRLVIGKGGETINKMIAEFGVEIDINDDGKVTVTAKDQDSGNKACAKIKQIAYVPKEGDILEGVVVRLLDFGALVEIAPDKVGMVHISELDKKRVAAVKDVVKEGDKIKVKVLRMEADGKIALSRKALL